MFRKEPTCRQQAETQSGKLKRLGRKTLALGVIALLGIGGTVVESSTAQAAEVSFPVDLNFDTRTAGADFSEPGYTAIGDSGTLKYTGANAANSGKNGTGWLQLTPRSNQLTGGFISEGSIPSNEGTTFDFDYRAFASVAQRADGLTFFLLDADQPMPSKLGAAGAGLGYSSACVSTTDKPGIEHGFLGVAFDAYGSFSDKSFRNDPYTLGGTTKDSVVLRGSGTGTKGLNQAGKCGVEYAYAAGKQITDANGLSQNATDSTAKFRRARVVVMPQEGTGPRITVSLSALTPVGDQPTSWQENLIDYSVTPGDGKFTDLPQNLRFGFAGVTGGLNMATQIGNVRATSNTDAALTASDMTVTEPASQTTRPSGVAYQGDDVSFSLTASNNGPSEIGAPKAPGESTVFHDLGALGLHNVQWTCEAAGGATCAENSAQGGTAVNQEWTAPVGGSVTLNVTAQVADDAAAGDKTSTAVIPTLFPEQGNPTLDPASTAITKTGSVSDPNLANNSASFALNISTNPSATNSKFSVSAGTRTVGSTDEPHTLTAEALDSANQVKEGVAVTFSAPAEVTLSGEGVTTSEDGITTAITTAQGIAFVEARSDKAGTYNVSASLGEARIGEAKSIQFVAGPPSVGGEDSKSSYTVSEETRKADGEETHTVTAVVLDAQGNPASGVNVKFDAGDATVVPAEKVTDAQGKAEAEISTTLAGNYTVTATVDGTPLKVGDNSVASFVAGDSSLGATGKSVVTIDAGPKLADGDAAYNVTAKVVDANDNPKSGVAVTFSSEPGNDTIPTNPVMTNAAGVAEISVTSEVAASYVIAAKVNEVVLKGSPVTARFDADAPDLGASGKSNLSVTLTPGAVANGEDKHTATATVLDAKGNPVPGVTVKFSAPEGVTVTPESGTTGADGTLKTDVTSTRAGTVQVTATVGDVALKGSPASMTFKAGAASISQSSWTVSPGGPVVADGEQAYTATVTVLDANSNGVPGATVSFDVPDGLTLLPGSLETNDEGVVTAKFTATKADEYTLSAKLGNDTIGQPNTLKFVAGSVAAGSSTISVTPGIVQANGTHEAVVTISLLDAKGNAVTNAGDVVVLNAMAGTISSPITQLPNGTYQAKLTSTVAGEVEITFTVEGVDATATATVKFVATPAKPVLKPSNGSVIAGTATVGNTIELYNAANEKVGSAAVGPEGEFFVISLIQLNDGDVVTAIAIDENGFESAPATVTIDQKKPEAPTVDPSNGKQITGGTIAEGDVVTVVDGDGNPIEGEVTIDEDGKFTFVPKEPLDESDSVRVVITTPAGNVTESEEVVIKTTPPAVPAVDPSNGKQITGGPIAEGDEVTVIDKDGNPIEGDVVIDEDGKFTFVPKEPLDENEPVKVVIVDSAGNKSEPKDVVVKTTPPAVPAVDPSNGKQITGGPIAEGDKVTVIDKDGNPIEGDVVIDEDGKFTFVPKEPLDENEPVKVVIVDSAGNKSEPKDVVVKTTPPAVPAVDPSNGKQITGGPIAEGDEVTVIDKDGNPIEGDVVIDEDGKFTFVPKEPLDENEPVKVVIVDSAGNKSEPKDVVVKTTPPAVPAVDPSNGKQITGGPIAEGDEVTVIDKDGNPIEGDVVIDEDGKFTFVPKEPLDENEPVKVVIVDSAGNKSEPKDVVVKTTPPAVPAVDPSNGKQITGGPIAEGDEVTVIDKDGNPIEGDVVIDEDGKFTFVPKEPLDENEPVKVVIVDSAGNKSEPKDVVVKTTPPAVPAVDPSNGKQITGGPIAEGDEVTVIDKDGNPIEGDVVIDEDGKFTFVPKEPLDENEPVKVVIVDSAGNKSEPKDVVVKTTPPAVPAVDPSNGKQITGGPIAEGDEVTVIDKDGNPIEGDVVIDEDGKFTFVPKEPLDENEPVKVVIVDSVGNKSEPKDVVVKTTPPAVPVVDPSNGKKITGGPIAKGDTVKVLDKDGNEVPGKVVVDNNGKFTFVPNKPIDEKNPVSVVVVDVVGNVSGKASVSVKTTPPAKPVIDPTDGSKVTGGPIEKGSTVTIVDRNGKPIPGVVVVGSDGRFTFTPKAKIPANAQPKVVVTDQVGNSTEVKFSVDSVEKACVTPRSIPVFADAPLAHKFYKEIDWMECMKYSTGWKQASGKPLYKPTDTLERQAMAAFIYRMEAPKGYKAPKVSPFADVQTSDKFYTEIAWMFEKGYSKGWASATGKPTYRPNDSLSREAMAAFIYRLEASKDAKVKAYQAPKSSKLADMKPGAKFYKEISWMYDSKLSTGNKVGATKEYWPKHELSRQAMAAFIYRLVNDYRS